jgi:hypothetical protein
VSLTGGHILQIESPKLGAHTLLEPSITRYIYTDMIVGHCTTMSPAHSATQCNHVHAALPFSFREEDSCRNTSANIGTI